MTNTHEHTHEHDTLAKLYQIGCLCLDNVAMYVFEPVIEPQVSPKKRRFSILNGFRPSTQGNASAAALPTAEKSTSVKRKSIASFTIAEQPLSEDEINRLVPILCEAANCIFLFFEKNPLTPVASTPDSPKSPRENVSTSPTISPPTSPKLSKALSNQDLFSRLRVDTNVFLNLAESGPISIPSTVSKLWSHILNLLGQLASFQSTPKAGMESAHLEEIITATERILKTAPRYTLQTCAVSPAAQVKISQAQVIQFLDRLVSTNKAYESQRAYLKSRIAQNEEDTIERIWSVQKRRLENQCFEMNPRTVNNMKMGAVEGILNTQSKSEYKNQMWTPPKILKEEALEKMKDQFDKIDTQLTNQRYVQTPQQQKEMFLGKVKNHMERLGGRFEKQVAMTKEEYKNHKFDEINLILDTARGRYDDQRTQKRDDDQLKQKKGRLLSVSSPCITAPIVIPDPKILEVSKSQELDGWASRMPRLEGQTAQTPVQQPKETKPELTKSQELDAVVGLLAKMPRLDSQTADSSKVIPTLPVQSSDVLSTDKKNVEKLKDQPLAMTQVSKGTDLTKSQELDGLAKRLDRLPRLQSQTANTSKVTVADSTATPKITKSQVAVAGMDSDTAAITSENRSESEKLKELNSLVVVQTPLPSQNEVKAGPSSKEAIAL